MPWKHNGRVITIGKAWVSDDNIKYPRQWNNLSSTSKESAGLVWEDDATPLGPFDSFYYYGWNSDYKHQKYQKQNLNLHLLLHLRIGI